MATLSSQQRDAIWNALDKLRRHHRAFQDAKWALHEDDLERIEMIAAKFQPADLVVKNRFLFDDQMPDVELRALMTWLLTTRPSNSCAPMLFAKYLRAKDSRESFAWSTLRRRRSK